MIVKFTFHCHSFIFIFKSLFQNFECEFGIISTLLGCRHVIESPFRANVVRIVSQDYSNHHRPYWKIEFGGMDYLEGKSSMIFSLFHSSNATELQNNEKNSKIRENARGFWLTIDSKYKCHKGETN